MMYNPSRATRATISIILVALAFLFVFMVWILYSTYKGDVTEGGCGRVETPVCAEMGECTFNFDTCEYEDL